MTPEQRAAVVAEAESWLKTPYHHHAAIKGVGVDCAHLLIETYSSAGVVARIDPGMYPHDWHLHRSEEMFVRWIETAGGRRVDSPETGDIGLWKFGRCFSHGGIYVGNGEVIHAYLRLGVIRSEIHEALLCDRAVQWWSI